MIKKRKNSLSVYSFISFFIESGRDFLIDLRVSCGFSNIK